MKFHNLFESGTQEFHWYENPTQEQIKDVAGEQNKVRFVAYSDEKVIVYPYEESPKEFLAAIGKPLDADKAVHGIALKAGFGWVVSKIVNKSHFEPDESFNWVSKYFIIKHLLKKDYKITRDETEKLMQSGGRHQPENKVGEAENLRDYLKLRKMHYPRADRDEKN